MKKVLVSLVATACLAAVAVPAGAAEPAPRQSVVIRTNFEKYGLAQSEIYRLQVEAGALTIRLGSLYDSVRLVLEDPATGEFLLDQWVYPGEHMVSATLPKAGTYRLLLAPNQVDMLAVDGPGLVAATQTPAVRMPDIKPYETRNTGFTFTPELLNADAVASVKVTLNDSVLREGTVGPVTVDPTTLADGIYRLRTQAEGTAGNQGLVSRTFLVDRVDAFGDVKAAHWARPYVEVMHHLGVINGRGAGAFAPAQPVTRAEFAKMLALTIGLEPSGVGGGPAFADVAPDHWAVAHIAALAEQKVIQGETVDGVAYFRPDRTITRAEAATILGRLLGVSDGEAGEISFTDADAIPEWARPAVAALAEYGWIQGFPDGNYRPAANLQRDQAARVLANFLGM